MHPDDLPDQPPPPPSPDPARPDGGADAKSPPVDDAPARPSEAGGERTPSFRVLRSRRDRRLGGVAGGLAVAMDIDPTLVRLGIVLGCLTGWGILAYLVAWAVIPEEDPGAGGRHLVAAPEPTGKHLRIGLAVVAGLGVLQVLGTVLGVISSALIGIGLLPARVFGIAGNDGFEAGEAALGLLLLIGGLLLVFRRHLPWMPAPDTGAGPGSSFSGPAGAPGSVGSGNVGSGNVGSGASGGYGPPPPASGAPGAAGFSARASAAARAARSNGPLLVARATGWLAGLWFLAAALVAGAFWLTGALDVRLPVVPIVTGLAALGTLGYVLIRSRRIAAVVGAMALLLVPTVLAGALARVDGQAGDRSVTLLAVDELQPEYRHAIGVLTLDLSRLPLPPGRTPLDVSMGAGKVEIVVPWDADVEARATIALGTFDLFGNRQTGVNLNGRTRSTGQPGAPLLVISSEAGAGEIIVRRGYEPFTQQALRTGRPVPMECVIDPPPYGGVPAAGSLSCRAADGDIRTPALACVVAESGAALCRPPGEPEPVVDFADAPGSRRCQVPAGGGRATCTVPNTPAPPADPSGATTTATTPPAAPGEYLCTIPEGGGPATCRPA